MITSVVYTPYTIYKVLGRSRVFLLAVPLFLSIFLLGFINELEGGGMRAGRFQHPPSHK